MVKDTLYKVCEGMELSTKIDKTWLHFKSTQGKKCSFCVEDKFPRICVLAIREWAYERIELRPIYFGNLKAACLSEHRQVS